MTDEKRKGGRKATGTVVMTKSGRRQGIITLADGRRKRLRPFPVGTSKAYARERTLYWAERAQREGIVFADEPEPEPIAPADSCEPWLATWLADRVARGYTTTRENASHYRLHMQPSLGDKHVRDWTRDDMRKLSHDLDLKVQAGAMSWKTAVNVWATATKMCADAANAKRDDIKCRDDNPAAGVLGPDRGDERGKQFLYPSEFLRFIECPAVPLRWKRLAATAIYLYPRDAELRVLDCENVNLSHGNVHINRALSRKTGNIKATKGRRDRRVPIDPSLAPLLEVLIAEAGGTGRLFPDFPSEGDMPRGLRRWLKRAGVTRRELHERTPTSVPITFHDLRATGITWMAVRGDDPIKIQHRAGHTDFATTQRYIRLAEALRDGFGEVFPALPAELLEQSSDHLKRSLARKYPIFGGATGLPNGLLRGIAEENGQSRVALTSDPTTSAPRNPATDGRVIGTAINWPDVRAVAADRAIAGYLRSLADSVAARLAPLATVLLAVVGCGGSVDRSEVDALQGGPLVAVDAGAPEDGGDAGGDARCAEVDGVICPGPKVPRRATEGGAR